MVVSLILAKSLRPNLLCSSFGRYLLDPNLETVRSFGVEYNPLELADAVMAEFTKAQK